MRHTTRATRRRGGQVMIITLLAILLLVGLIFYVMNVGDQVNRRMAVQDAADSAAMSGTIQMARSMNTVAMNNITMARMLSLVLVLDLQPAHLYTSRLQAKALLDRLNDQLPDAGPGGPMHEPTLRMLTTVRDKLQREHEEIIPADELFNHSGFDVTEATTYRRDGSGGTPPHGHFWVAARHADQFNQGTVDSASVAAQVNAARYARASRAEGGLLTPVLPKFPAVRGQWLDWCRNPVTRDTLLVDGWIPDLGFGPRRRWRQSVPEPYTDEQIAALLRNPGPFVKLYAWRDAHSDWLETQNEGLDPGGGMNPPWPPAPQGQRGDWHWYTTYGPVTWARRVIDHYWSTDLYYSIPRYRNGDHGGLDRIFHDLLSTKLRYMFAPEFGAGGEIALQERHEPEWEIDWVKARDRGEAEDEETEETNHTELTIHFRLYIQGEYGPDDPRLASIIDDSAHTNLDRPGQVVESGWHNRSNENARTGITVKVHVTASNPPEGVPKDFDVHIHLHLSKPWQKIATHIWHADFSPDEWLVQLKQRMHRSVMQRAREFLPEEERNAMEEFEYTTQYEKPPWVIIRDAFGGADFGDDGPSIHNPSNYNQDDRDQLPMPYLLDRSVGEYDIDEHDHDEGIRRRHYSFLGVAWQSSQPRIWSERFGRSNPSGKIVSVAQTELYNPTSWDLWTQDWRAQLVPVTKLDEWTDRLAEGEEDIDDVRGVIDSDDFEEALRFLRAIDEQWARSVLQH